MAPKKVPQQGGKAKEQNDEALGEVHKSLKKLHELSPGSKSTARVDNQKSKLNKQKQIAIMLQRSKPNQDSFYQADHATSEAQAQSEGVPDEKSQEEIDPFAPEEPPTNTESQADASSQSNVNLAQTTAIPITPEGRSTRSRSNE